MPRTTPTAPTGGRMSRRKLVLIVLLVALLLAAWWAWRHRDGRPADYDTQEMHFKYGSIGADHPLAQAPLPYWLWKALPRLFDPAEVIKDGRGPNNGLKGWAAFGLYEEPEVDLRPTNHQAGQPSFIRPVGFSTRRVFGMDFVGMNCAFCHQGSIRATSQEKPQLIVGGTGNTVDIEKYFLFLFSSLTDPRLTPDRVMAAVDAELKAQNAELGFFTRFLYRWVLIPLLPAYLGKMENTKFDFITLGKPGYLPDFGPGRVDTWSLYKRTFVKGFVPDGISGASDFPPLWNQKARTGMRLHWDGNTNVLLERNIISALSLIGPRLNVLDFERVERVGEYIEELLPPRYADHPGAPPIDDALAARGQEVFNQQCGRCHLPTGDRFGHVEPIAGLDTDKQRFIEFTPALQDALNTLGTRQWQLRNFRVQAGYVNGLLDGIWLRGPYLHNGSVPTLRELLTPPADRTKVFCRGSDVYDWKNLGFVSAPVMAGGEATCPGLFLYDTRDKDKVTGRPSGRTNGGHFYGTGLPQPDKEALLEFMKTM